MKNIILLIFFISCYNFAWAQKVSEKNVPENLKVAFKKEYPMASSIKWEKEKANYEVNFKNDKTEYSLLMDLSGNILETEKEITIDKLPDTIRTFIKKNYPGKNISEASMITDHSGVVTYEAEIHGVDLLFNNAGELIKSSKNTKDTEY